MTLPSRGDNRFRRPSTGSLGGTGVAPGLSTGVKSTARIAGAAPESVLDIFTLGTNVVPGRAGSSGKLPADQRRRPVRPEKSWSGILAARLSLPPVPPK